MIKKCFMFLPIIDTNTVTTKIVLEKCVFMVFISVDRVLNFHAHSTKKPEELKI